MGALGEERQLCGSPCHWLPPVRSRRGRVSGSATRGAKLRMTYFQRCETVMYVLCGLVAAFAHEFIPTLLSQDNHAYICSCLSFPLDNLITSKLLPGFLYDTLGTPYIYFP